MLSPELKNQIKGVSGITIERSETNARRFKLIDQGYPIGYCVFNEGKPELVEIEGGLNKDELEGLYVAFREIENAGQ